MRFVIAKTAGTRPMIFIVSDDVDLQGLKIGAKDLLDVSIWVVEGDEVNVCSTEAEAIALVRKEYG